MNKKLMEALYNNIVEDNLELYKTFFESDSDEEGVIDYWKNAIKFYSNLSLADQDLLFSIIKSTIIDTISNMFAIADGGEIIGNYSIEIKINNEIAVHNNPNGTCNYCDKGLATLLPENATLEVIPPANASAPNKYWIDVPKTYIGNNKMPKIE